MLLVGDKLARLVASTRIAVLARASVALLTLLAEPDLTHCEMGNLNSAQPNRGQNSLFSLRPSFGTPTS